MATTPTAPLRDCLDRLDDAEHRWSGERMARHDAHWIRREFALMVRMLRHACNRGLMACGDTSVPPMIEMAEDAQMMLREYETIWLLRNRQGGLEDSISGLRRLASEYLA